MLGWFQIPTKQWFQKKREGERDGSRLSILINLSRECFHDIDGYLGRFKRSDSMKLQRGFPCSQIPFNS